MYVVLAAGDVATFTHVSVLGSPTLVIFLVLGILGAVHKLASVRLAPLSAI